MQAQTSTQLQNRRYNCKPIDFVICDEPQFFYGVFNDTNYQKTKRIKNIKKHVNAQDYFGTLSAILSLFHQNNKKNIKEIEKCNKALEKFVDDLSYLQKNYKIIKK